MLCALILISTLNACASTATEERRPEQIGHWRSLRSEVLDEARSLVIYLPRGYDRGTKQHPVLYLLDGPSNFKVTAGIVHALSRSNHMPEMIVVGIANTDRWRDMTPVAQTGLRTSGGGDAFLRFMDEELVPFIDDQYRTSQYRIFVGHSLGGLMALEALVKHTDTFDAYIAVSPSVEWDDGSLIDRYVGFLREQDSLEKHLCLSIADERTERPYYDRLVREFEQVAPGDFRWHSKIMEDEDHMSVRDRAIRLGLRNIYRDWKLSSARITEMSFEGIDAHYREAGKRYGASLSLTLYQIIDAAYWAIENPETVDRGLALLERAVELYPNRPYPLDSLGECLDRLGHPERALALYEEAFALAEKQGVVDLDYFRWHLEGLRERLGKK